jgi:hypothetical protein
VKLQWVKTQPWLGLPVVLTVVLLWTQPYTHYSPVPLEFVIPGLLLLVLLGAFVSRTAWAWWALGLVTLLWSLTPSRTLNGGLWEVLYLVGFAAGAAVFSAPRAPGTDWKSHLTSPIAWFWGLQWYLLLDNLQTALALNAAGMQFLASGSHHYLMGAQALLLVGASLPALKRADALGWLAWLGLGIAVYACVISGARAVQLPLVLMLAFALWQLWREHAHVGLVLARVALVGVCVAGSDVLLAGQPVQTGLGRSVAAANASDFRAEGSAGSRVLMWSQVVQAALERPLGTGNAGFKDVLPAFQKYPSINFASAHNYYLETLMTGGWLRLVALLALLLPVLWRGWRSGAWGLALGTAGLWATLAFDISGYMPSVMTLAFMALGAMGMAAAGGQPFKGSRVDVGVRWGLTAVAVALALWWYAPCSSTVSCVVDRHRSMREAVVPLALNLQGQERAALLEAAQRDNPRSLWVQVLRLELVGSPTERLRVLQAITAAYPLAAPSFYLQQAQLEAATGARAQAVVTLERGLRVFPVGTASAGVPLRQTDPLEVWSREAPKLLEQFKRP